MGERITVGDRDRWKKHYRSFKRQAYAFGFGSDAYRRNYDRVDWGRKDCGYIDLPGGGVVVKPDIGEEYDYSA